MRKLICMISGKGKTKRQLTKEVIKAFQKQGLLKYDVPEGIYRCKKCGEYKGKTKAKNLNWDGGTPEDEGIDSEHYLTFKCICEGITCHRCKKNDIRRPISNHYMPETNSFQHTPYFGYMVPCEECRKELRKNSQ